MIPENLAQPRTLQRHPDLPIGPIRIGQLTDEILGGRSRGTSFNLHTNGCARRRG